MRRSPWLRACLCLVPVLGLAAATPALAHHTGGGPDSGLPIPSLTHGAMRSVAARRADVLALADAQVRTDPAFRRLRNFIALQHAFCGWSLMPGSVTDEASPFNECTHADLAAVRALLRHMAEMPAARTAALALESRIAVEERLPGADPVLCRFSDEPFNTADVIGPHWTAVPGHIPTLLVLLAAFAFLSAGATVVWAAARSDVPASG